MEFLAIIGAIALLMWLFADPESFLLIFGGTFFLIVILALAGVIK